MADCLSRYSDCDDWGIDESVFKILDQLWGRHTVDRFATEYNTKCKRFISKYWCQNTETLILLHRTGLVKTIGSYHHPVLYARQYESFPTTRQMALWWYRYDHRHLIGFYCMTI